jgi:hypothetical protein
MFIHRGLPSQLGRGEPRGLSQTDEGVTVELPGSAPDKIDSLVVLCITGPAHVAPDALGQ